VSGVDETVAELRVALGRAWGDDHVHIRELRRLSGGATSETWSFDAVLDDGSAVPLVLRRTRGPTVDEGALLRAAATAGVPVPGVVAELGGGLVLARIEGETIPRRILRERALDGARGRLAGQCGEILARLHAIPVDAVPGLEHPDPLPVWRAMLDGLEQPHPAFELALRWLREREPPRGRTSIVHGDFRNGNLVVGPDGVRAVLDWELAHLGDPMEDLGWLCVRAWRFGEDARRVGGFGDERELFTAYEEAGGGDVDPVTVRWWEVLGTLKWGIMCIVQAVTHLSGASRSVELAAIGRRVCENEWDLLDLIEAG
jgi:aminoglycoside phosphotransferase (APT) family kinase protein